MGKSGSGKTSMRSIIFANYLARDTFRLGATLEVRVEQLGLLRLPSLMFDCRAIINQVEHSHVKFLGNLVLNLWDCGGQEKFMESYFESQRDLIFRNVEVLIYVFDIESKEKAKDLAFFQSCLEAIAANSRNAHIFCLIHKMDVLKSDQERATVFEEKQTELSQMAHPLRLTCFQTSIWDETLYKVWLLIS